MLKKSNHLVCELWGIAKQIRMQNAYVVKIFMQTDSDCPGRCFYLIFII